ncbi:MAG TPA: hypothetical protein VIY48_22245 [Candidatus Paceibacterota bacterium]
MKSHPEDCAAQIVAEIIADLRDRRGLKHEWNQIDSDIQQEIKEEWIKIALDHLKGCA